MTVTITQEEVAQIKRSLDGLTMGALSVYDVGKVLPHPYNAIGDMANHWAHDFVSASFHIIKVLERLEQIESDAEDRGFERGLDAAAMADRYEQTGE